MNQPDQQELPKKQRRGCLFYGGIAAVILLLLVLGGVAVGYMTIRKAINTWADTKPAKLPVTEMSQPEAAAIQQRVSSFGQALEKGASTPPLVLSAREINGLLANSPEYAQFRDKIHVEIQNGAAKAQMSFPLDHIGIGFLKGRYLNGTGTFKTALDSGNLRVTLDNVLVNGKPLPGNMMTKIRAINFAQAINDDPRAAAFLKKIAAIEVKDGKIALVPQSSQ